MTIQDAIKDGRDFRRKFWDDEIIVIGANFSSFQLDMRYRYVEKLASFSYEDILADDWEFYN